MLNIGTKQPIRVTRRENRIQASAVIEVDEVRSRHQRNAFVRVPWNIYKDDPLWVPPLLMERKEFINPNKHPFFLHGAATQFLASMNGQWVGRILVSDDAHYNATHGSNTGCFGMFESIDEPRVAHALLSAAAGWLRARGRTHMLGPIDYSTNYSCGLLVDGFDTPPRVLMNHNPPYYARLIESWGFTKAKDLWDWWIDLGGELPRRWMARCENLRRRSGAVIRPFRLDDAKAEIDRCKAVYNQAWDKNWGFVKMTDAEFAYFAKDLLDWVPPELLLIAEVDGKPVGLTMALPDFNEALRPLDGRIFRWGMPLGLLQFRRNCRRIRSARLIALGVLEAYRRRGLVQLLIAEVMQSGLRQGYTGAACGWTLEDNDAINRAIAMTGATRYKTYRIYEKTID
ncbi:MAG TPA: GNAT family N-acetyltransferase [Pirellulales bacterium]|jgi:GNAT superfamily N-acetyltransferase|nr:GNAT family N-acetyltransferase [Pirellulales bacterium]